MGLFDDRRQRVVHEVTKGSNLDLLVRGFHGIANRFVDALQAIALALSAPQDNSAEVQRQIDAIASKMSLDAAEQQDALDKLNQTKEN